MSSIQAIVTDLDGVIRVFPADRDQKIEAKYGLPAGAILRVAFSPRLLLPAIKGVLPDELWRERIALELAQSHPRINCRAAVAEWSDFPGQVETETLWFLRAYCSSMPLILLTNATSRLEEDLRKLDILRTFDKIFSSSLLGIAKPEPAVFRKVASLLLLEPREILFLDDSIENTAAAAAEGFQVIHYQGLEALKKELL
jgi:FMN phosphatase YigB (HAD superfamily)